MKALNCLRIKYATDFLEFYMQYNGHLTAKQQVLRERCNNGADCVTEITKLRGKPSHVEIK